MELVSIIMPYFKKIDFIDETIESILNQTYNKFELLIIYDDVDKEELNYLKQIADKDKRINILQNNENLGAGLSRNKGIDNSQGKFIAFIDSDDIWFNNKLEKQIKFMNEKNCYISHTSYQIINSKNEFISNRIARDFDTFKSLLKSCDIGLSTVIMDKSIFSNELKFPKIKTKEDFVLWLKVLKKNHKIKALNENLSKWRKLENSLSSSIFQKIKDGFKVYNHYMGFNFLISSYLLMCLCINFLKKND